MYWVWLWNEHRELIPLNVLACVCAVYTVHHFWDAWFPPRK